jgi:2-polyprenyl-3-methyl-5-hydroxy-6-metoxy-1,4-benzoquinol methylase
MPDAVTEINARAKAVWSGGDWDAISELIAEVGPQLLARLGDLSGKDLLDVGTGSGGTVAIPAALRGARVVGSDLTDEWFGAARRRADAAGVEVEWVETNAEDLQFPDESFDVVTSTFGHMFAPRHAVAAGEMARVLRPGGVIATTTWIPRGYGGAMFGLIAEYMPKPPDFVEPPTRWGVQEHVEAMFEPHGLHVEFDEGAITLRWDDADAFADFFVANFGPMVAAREVVGSRWPELDERFRALVREHDTGTGTGGIELTQDYLVTLARKP